MEGLGASCVRIFHLVSQKSVGLYSTPLICENTGQRICIKFCFKLGKRDTETYEMMKTAFGDETMRRAWVFEWFRRFKEGRQSMNSGPRFDARPPFAMRTRLHK
ncbi:hypothetical protein TNCV_3373711 [Trichonephila clavipes]|nr:hypothetical protein TNCV_3373711 [Trichonephila clavipes]